MKSFGTILRELRENQGLPLRKVAAELDIDTSILSKIERDERHATKDMLPVLAKTLQYELKDLEIKFISYSIKQQFGDMKNLKDALKSLIETV